MKTRIRPAITVLFVGALTLLLLGIVPAAGAKNDKGKICHRTGSSSNPYVVNSPRHGTGKGHSTHPEKGGRTDKDADSNAPKGPTRKSGYSCEQAPPPPPPPPPPNGNGACPPGTADCPIPPPPPPPNGEPGIPPGPFAGPAPAIAGQPTVTG